MNKLSNLKAVVLDYGEVLCLPPTPDDVEGSARILGIGSDLFRNLWGRNRDLYDRGDLTPEIYWQRFAEDAGARLTAAQVQELAERDVVMWSRLNPNMVAWLEALRAAGVKTAVLSNMHIGMVQHARREFQWLNLVHCTTLSAEIDQTRPSHLRTLPPRAWGCTFR